MTVPQRERSARSALGAFYICRNRQLSTSYRMATCRYKSCCSHSPNQRKCKSSVVFISTCMLQPPVLLLQSNSCSQLAFSLPAPVLNLNAYYRFVDAFKRLSVIILRHGWMQYTILSWQYLAPHWSAIVLASGVVEHHTPLFGGCSLLYSIGVVPYAWIRKL